MTPETPRTPHPAVIGGSVMACPGTDMDGVPICTYRARRGDEVETFGSYEAAAAWLFRVPMIARVAS